MAVVNFGRSTEIAVSKISALPAYVLAGGVISAAVTAMINVLMTQEVETAIILGGAIIWGVVGATAGGVLGVLAMRRAR